MDQGPIAQSVELPAHNRLVTGSSPVGPTRIEGYPSGLDAGGGFFCPSIFITTHIDCSIFQLFPLQSDRFIWQFISGSGFCVLSLAIKGGWMPGRNASELKL